MFFWITAWHTKEPACSSSPFVCSVHLRVEEKVSLACGRDGGLQSMEILGMITLQISDEKSSRIQLHVANNDKKGAQLQVWRLPYQAEVPEIIVLDTAVWSWSNC